VLWVIGVTGAGGGGESKEVWGFMTKINFGVFFDDISSIVCGHVRAS